MLNFYKFIEILVSLQSLFISTMIPVFITLPFTSKFKNTLEIPITWQIPAVILITLIFKQQIVFKSLTIYLFIGLFLIPIFHDGGSLGYLLTPNFGYLIGFYPLIKIIENVNKKIKINIFEFLKIGILAITSMHIVGIIYSLIQMIYYKKIDLFLYNLGNYSLGKIGYHFLMLLPLYILVKPINNIKFRY